MSVDEVFSVVLRDAPFHRRSGGGLTVSGGEPLMHYPFVRALFEATHAQGIHNALDTSGLCPWEPLAALAPFVDLFLYDVKHLDPDRHIALTGVSNERILDNLHRLNGAGKTLWVRVPLIPGQNDDLANYHAMGRLFATLKRIERVELLRYHRLAEAKYARMGLEYPLAGLATPSEADAESRRRLLESYGLPRVTWR
jgi:pyruvate formate lyase activating enzyme